MRTAAEHAQQAGQRDQAEHDQPGADLGLRRDLRRRGAAGGEQHERADGQRGERHGGQRPAAAVQQRRHADRQHPDRLHDGQRRHAERHGVHARAGDEQDEPAEPAGLPQQRGDPGTAVAVAHGAVLEAGGEREEGGADDGQEDRDAGHAVTSAVVRALSRQSAAASANSRP